MISQINMTQIIQKRKKAPSIASITLFKYSCPCEISQLAAFSLLLDAQQHIDEGCHIIDGDLAITVNVGICRAD